MINASIQHFNHRAEVAMIVMNRWATGHVNVSWLSTKH